MNNLNDGPKLIITNNKLRDLPIEERAKKSKMDPFVLRKLGL